MSPAGCYFLDQLQLSLWMRSKNGSSYLLKDREREVFLKLYALWDSREWQHEEVADDLCLSRERIRQLEMKVFKKLGYRKKQASAPAGRLYALLTGNRPQAGTDKESLALHLHDFHATHLPEWDKARFFRFAEHFLKVNKLADILKKTQKDRQAVRKPKDKLEHIYGQIIWPQTVIYHPEPGLHSFSPQRTIQPEQDNGISVTGEYFSAKLQRMVFYESALEKTFFKAVEQSPNVPAYCEQPFTLSMEFNGKTFSYTPDILLQLKDGRRVVIEIKPLAHMVDTEVQRKFQHLSDYCREQGWGCLLTDGKHDLPYLSLYPSNPAFEQALLQALAANRRLTNGYIRSLQKEHGANSLHLARCILRHDLSYRTYPTLLWSTKGGGICQVLKKQIREKNLVQQTFFSE